MGPFQFLRTPRIVFGPGSLGELGNHAASFGRRAVLLTGASSLKSTGTLSRVESALRRSNIEFLCFAAGGEPSPDYVDAVVRGGREFNPDCVIAVGGGSVMDAGKAVSAMLPSGASVKRFLEGVGAEKPSGEKVPMIAAPTTSGTGSEATANAVLSEPGENGFKKSLRHANFVPDVAIVDPDLAAGCPPAVAAACGMDAFTQLLESYVSAKASPVTDALARSGIQRLRDGILPACAQGPENPEARRDMAYAALMSGIALANAGLGTVHGIAGAVGARFRAPHGAACGILVEPVTRATITRLFDAAPGHPALRKYADIGHLLSNSRFDTVENGCERLLDRIGEWTRELRLPGLGAFGVAEPDLEGLAAGSANRNNPVELDIFEIRRILTDAL